LDRAFPPPQRTQNKHLLSEQINQRKQFIDESVHDYYYALDHLCRMYDQNMSPLEKTIKLVGGLRDELKEKLLPLNIRTPDEFLTQAKNYESSEQVMNQQPNNQRRQLQQQSNNPRQQFNQQQLNHRMRNYQQQKRNEQTNPQQSTRNNYQDSNTPNRSCYTCGELGHLARNCPNHLNE